MKSNSNELPIYPVDFVQELSTTASREEEKNHWIDYEAKESNSFEIGLKMEKV